MSKLFKLKQWLTIGETAKHLSNVLSEPVSEADVLKLGLDEHLKLSINFTNGAPAKKGTVVSYQEAKGIIQPRINPEFKTTYQYVTDILTRQCAITTGYITGLVRIGRLGLDRDNVVAAICQGHGEGETAISINHQVIPGIVLKYQAAAFQTADTATNGKGVG